MRKLDNKAITFSSANILYNNATACKELIGRL